MKKIKIQYADSKVWYFLLFCWWVRWLYACDFSGKKINQHLLSS